jgi:hypothetical protein
VSGLVDDAAVVALVGIAGWLVGAYLIPDRWIPRRRPRRWNGRWREGRRRAVLRVVARVALRVALWAARHAAPEEPDRRCGRRSQHEADR